MKSPNAISLLVMLGVVAPAVIAAISQQFPPEVFWWSMLVTGVIGVLAKTAQVWVDANKARGQQPPAGAMGAPAPAAPSKLRAILWE